jgi:hypothetical protein
MKNDKLKEYFDRYPNSDECYVTSDDNIFHKDFDAKSHARSLEGKTVVRHARPSAGDVVAETRTTPDGSQIVDGSSPQTPQADKGVTAVAPVVVEKSGEMISPGAGETSTSPVAAPGDDTGKERADVPQTGTGNTGVEFKPAVEVVALPPGANLVDEANANARKAAEDTQPATANPPMTESQKQLVDGAAKKAAAPKKSAAPKGETGGKTTAPKKSAGGK